MVKSITMKLMENKQTPIEWLYKLSKKRELDKFDLDQAKAMEQDVWIPTDEEIENWASYDSHSLVERLGMIRGAKWMRKTLVK